MKSPIHQDARISAFFERKMRSWEQLQETAARTGHRLDTAHTATQQICYVAISREAGAAGTSIARLVGNRLAWEVYDSNLLDKVAQRNHESRLMLDLVDETKSNWVYDIFGTWMDPQVVPHEKYAVQLSRMVRMLARAGNAVFVGRGAQFILPPAKTFSVRIVAPEAFRAQRIQERHNVSLQEALDAIRRTDRGRREFVRRFFRQDITDPNLYDLVVNVGRFGPAGAAEEIVHAVRRSAG